jgi:hypothetical protein
LRCASRDAVEPAQPAGEVVIPAPADAGPEPLIVAEPASAEPSSTAKPEAAPSSSAATDFGAAFDAVPECQRVRGMLEACGDAGAIVAATMIQVLTQYRSAFSANELQTACAQLLMVIGMQPQTFGCP